MCGVRCRRPNCWRRTGGTDLSESDAACHVHRWGRWETSFSAHAAERDALHDIVLEVEVADPSGRLGTVRGFWDGGATWRVRFAPDAVGLWTFRSRSRPAVPGLDGVAGGFTCVPYEGDNPLYRHGFVRVAPGGRHLSHADGTPFFYLADTTWNGPMRSTPQEWEHYLSDRAAKRFTAVQYLSTPFRACAHDADGHPAYRGREHIEIDPAFFQRLDARIDAINAHGLLAVPLLIHAGRDTALNPGHGLPEDQAVLLGRYLVARYGAHHVMWDLVAEAGFHAEGAERWRRFCRTVLGDSRRHPVTLHPTGMDWILDEFVDEPWLDVMGYQSAHGDNEAYLRWITQGPPSTDWRRGPARPFINLEPPYEGHIAYHSGRRFDAHATRRGIYWSLLVSPTAGVAYGAHGVWGWDDGTGPPMGEPRSGTPLPWRAALQMPGSTSMRHLHELFTSMSWWSLRPAPEMVLSQPGVSDASRMIVASRSEAGDVAVVYVPEGGDVALDLKAVGQAHHAHWWDPRTGERHAAHSPKARGTAAWQDTTPGEGDWLLVLDGGA